MAKKSVYRICVTETYEKFYEVEAYDVDKAIELAEEEASNDSELAIPENMTKRESCLDIDC